MAHFLPLHPINYYTIKREQLRELVRIKDNDPVHIIRAKNQLNRSPVLINDPEERFFVDRPRLVLPGMISKTAITCIGGWFGCFT